MATIDIVLWTKAKRDGTFPLRIRITKDRKQFYKSLGYSVEKKHWDNLRKKVKPSHQNSVMMNNFITRKLYEVQEIALETETKNKSASADRIKPKLNLAMDADFFQFAEKHLQRFNDLKSIGTYQARLV